MATKFEWSRNLDVSRSVNIDFNTLVGLPADGLRIPKTGGQGELFNIDRFLGAGHRQIPIFGFAGVRADLDASLGYDYGLRLDLGEANAAISGGLNIDIAGSLPQSLTTGNSEQSSLNFNLDIKPIELTWGLTSPSFRAWAYLFYTAGLDLDWYYDLPVPGWVGRALGLPTSDSGDIFEISRSGRLGNEIGFDSTRFGGKLSLTSGASLTGGLSLGVPPIKAPDWSEEIFPYVNLSLFSPTLAKPQSTSNGLQLSSNFPVLKLTGDLDQALSDAVGIPFSGDYDLDFGAVYLKANWALLDINPTLELNGFYDLGLEFDIDSIDVWNAEDFNNKKRIATLSKINEFKDTLGAVAAAVSNQFPDLNNNGQYDFEFSWSPKIKARAKAGFDTSVYVDFAALRAGLELGVDVETFLGDWSKSWRGNVGPLYSDRFNLFDPVRTTVLNTTLDLTNSSFIPASMRQLSIPLMIPRAINDPTRINVDFSLGLSAKRLYDGDWFSLPTEAKEITVPSWRETSQFNLESSVNDITIRNLSDGWLFLGLRLPTLSQGKNWNYRLLNNDQEVCLSVSQVGAEADLEQKKTDYIENYVNGGVFEFLDIKGKNTEVSAVDSYMPFAVIAEFGDGNDVLKGGDLGSVVSFGPGDDQALFKGALSYDSSYYSDYQDKSKFSELLIKRNWIPFSRAQSKGDIYFHFGSGSDSLIWDGTDNYGYNYFHDYGSDTKEFVFELDGTGFDTIDLSRAKLNEENSVRNFVRLLGSEVSRGHIDTVLLNYQPKPNDYSSRYSLQSIEINPVSQNNANSVSRPSARIISSTFQATPFLYLLDYSQVEPATNGLSLDGINLVLKSATNHSLVYENFSTAQLKYDQTTAAPYLTYSGDSTAINTVAVRGSQLNDKFSVDEYVLTVEGLGGDDIYILNAPFLPANSRWPRQNDDEFTSLGTQGSAVLGSTKTLARSSFIVDALGHSNVVIKEHALESFYRYGAQIIDLNWLELISERDQDFISAGDVNANGVSINPELKHLADNFNDSDLPTWTLDLSNISGINTDNVYSGIYGLSVQPHLTFPVNSSGWLYSSVEANYNGYRFVEMPSEIILGNGQNIFDPAAIWSPGQYVDGVFYKDINTYLPNFSLSYRLGKGQDLVYGYSAKDIFDVSEGQKQIIDTNADDSDTLILRRPIDTLILKVIDAGNGVYEISSKTDNSTSVRIQNIENIAFRYAGDSPTASLITYKTKNLFADMPILVRGLPSDKFVQWQQGGEAQAKILKRTIRVLPSALRDDGSLVISKSILTASLQALDGSETILSFMNGASSVRASLNANGEVLFNVDGGFKAGDKQSLGYALTVGGATYTSTLTLSILDITKQDSISIIDDSGLIRDANGNEELQVTVGNGAVITAGSLINILDSNGDGVIRGDDLGIDLNNDGIIDTLPAKDQIQSGLIDLSVQVDVSNPSPSGEVIVDVRLANPIVSNQYRKFFNGQWNSFLYSPAKPELGGAELLDENSDGLVERIRLHLFDGGPGDNDGVRNGKIADPGVMVQTAVIRGDQRNNKLVGTSEDDIFNGLEGADTMIGLAGDDVYIVDTVRDKIKEGMNAGNDRVESSVSFSLSALPYVEELTLTGVQAINGTGNNFNNVLVGNSSSNFLSGLRGDDILAGADGDDILDGGLGQDTLLGGNGADCFRLSVKPQRFDMASIDRITDFSVDQDRIEVSRKGFGIKAIKGLLSDQFFSVVSNESELENTPGLGLRSGALLVYDLSSGALFWNQNGDKLGAGRGGVIAVLDDQPNLSAANIWLL